MDNTNIQDYNAAVAAILRREYERSGISYSTLAATTGISRPTVVRVINGERPITAYYLRQLCSAFGISPSDVLDEADKNH